VQAELLQDVLDVHPGGGRRDGQAGRDLAVGPAAGALSVVTRLTHLLAAVSSLTGRLADDEGVYLLLLWRPDGAGAPGQVKTAS
jgi:hypothetical protein